MPLDVANRARARRDAWRFADGAQKGRRARAAPPALNSPSTRPHCSTSQRADCAAGRDAGLSAALLDRLRLSESRLESDRPVAREVAALPNRWERSSTAMCAQRLLVTRVRVPLGVVFFIYESRPNVTVDAASLCGKSGTPVILRGGKEAQPQQVRLWRALKARRLRKGRGLGRGTRSKLRARRPIGKPSATFSGARTDRRRHSARRPLADERSPPRRRCPSSSTLDGICHVYVDKSADFDMAERILINSKCQRPRRL